MTQPVAEHKRSVEGEVSLTGLIDMHIHTAPDVVPRLFDDCEATRAAAAAGLRAILIKSHVTLTADRAQLAEKTHDEALRAWLRMIYADQLADMRAVREVLWELAEKGQLPAQRLQWGMGLWNRSKHPERTIAVWERELRQGRVLHPELLPLLRDAYLAADRPVDARRADTEP